MPPGIPGNAEIDLGMGLSGNEKDFSATIGADPNDDTNVSQLVLVFRQLPRRRLVPADVHIGR